MYRPMTLFPSQVAILLGRLQRDIFTWIDRGELKANRNGRLVKIATDDLIEYLYLHPENVGRIYCDDLTTTLNEWRRNLVEGLEELRDAYIHKRRR